MATALRGHAFRNFMPTQSGGHGTHQVSLEGVLPEEVGAAGGDSAGHFVSSRAPRRPDRAWRNDYSPEICGGRQFSLQSYLPHIAKSGKWVSILVNRRRA